MWKTLKPHYPLPAPTSSRQRPLTAPYTPSGGGAVSAFPPYQTCRRIQDMTDFSDKVRAMRQHGIKYALILLDDQGAATYECVSAIELVANDLTDPSKILRVKADALIAQRRFET